MHDKKGLYTRDAGGSNGLVVDKAGRAVYFTGGSTNFVLRFATANTNVLYPTAANDASVSGLIESYGLGTQLPETPHDGSVFNIDGISYAVRESGEITDTISFTPAPSVWE